MTSKKDKTVVETDKEIIKKFSSDQLLEDIKQELSKEHLKDNNLKMTVFLVAVSGLLKNPKRRMSIALTGDSCVGKDNLIKTTLSHMPNYTSCFFTGLTKATIEDNIKVPILALSEMNLFRDFGANKDLFETVKQRTEGGINSMKKDAETGHKTAKISTSEQGTVIYGTTDAERDKEMETRFIFGDMGADYEKIKAVNKRTFDYFSDKNKLKNELDKKDSWIKKGLTLLKHDFEFYDVVIPFAKYLDGKINGEDIFDHNNPRSMRDIKRILALTCANTFIKGFKRKDSDLFLTSTIEDFIEVLEYCGDYFNQTYSGMDNRLREVLDIVNDFSGTWCPRDIIEKKLRKAKNTIKNYCHNLAELGLIEGIKGVNLCAENSLQSYDKNKIYYKRCQKGVKRVLIRCQISELKTYLDDKINNKIDTLIGKKVSKEGCQIHNNDNDHPKPPHFDTLELTPCKIKKEVKKDMGLKDSRVSKKEEPKIENLEVEGKRMVRVT